MPHSHSSNLPFEIRVYRSRDWGSRWNLFLLRTAFKALRRKSALKNSRKKVHARRSSPFCLGFPCLSSSSAFLASLDCEGLSWNGIRVLPHGVIYIDCQHQPGDSSWAKPQLFCSIHEHLRRLRSLHRNLSHQPLQFHPSVYGLLRSFVLLTLHYFPIGEEAGRSAAGFPLGCRFPSQSKSCSSICHQLPFSLRLGGSNGLFPSFCNPSGDG